MREGWSNDYIGIPFILGGRDPVGVDCWGLVCLIYEQELGLELLDHAACGPEDDTWMVAADKTKEQLIKQWEPVALPRQGHVYLFNVLGHECHVGIHVTDRYFLHSFNGRVSGLEQWMSGWSHRVKGCYELTITP